MLMYISQSIGLDIHGYNYCTQVLVSIGFHLKYVTLVSSSWDGRLSSWPLCLIAHTVDTRKVFFTRKNNQPFTFLHILIQYFFNT